MEAPLAVRLLLAPVHIVDADADAVMFGNWLLATVILMGEETQPPAVTVATMVWLPAARPLIVNGLLLNDCEEPPSTV